MPWANGRGTSYEVVRGGGGDWTWRVAIAPVMEDGPFSELPGVDRWLTVIDAGRLVLTVDGVERIISRGEVVAFAGESKVTARIPDGPVRDCGLMVRRRAGIGGMRLVGPGTIRTQVLIALEPIAAAVGDTSTLLDVGDALVGDDSSTCDVERGRACAIYFALH